MKRRDISSRAFSDMPESLFVPQNRNEQLARRAAQLSEEDFENMQREFEYRLALAEKRLKAVTRERD